jgi:accessory gene regulator B
MSFLTMVIAIFAGKIIIIPFYIQLVLIVLLPILGFLITPVKDNQKKEDRKRTGILTGAITVLLLLLDVSICP